MIDYLLVVLTHGASETLEPTIRSFREHVTPQPSAGYLHLDLVFDGDLGIGHAEDVVRQDSIRSGMTWMLDVAPRPIGFCASVAHSWKRASSPVFGCDYVFWLEHDFEFLGAVDVGAMAHTLDYHQHVAQMGLMREPVNSDEKDAGGLFNLYRDSYFPMGGLQPWILSRTNFSTTCSLMRTAFMEERPWPDGYDRDCEGRYSIDLLQNGYVFGVWGDGTPDIRHTGRRTGFGY